MNESASLPVFFQAPVKPRQHGFSLIEIALVLMIVGIALGGIAAALGPQLDNKNVRDTQESIKEASEAIMAFAMVNRRLPCPAAATSGGQEQWCTNAIGGCGAVITPPAVAPAHGRCANSNNGFVPAATLGLGGRGVNGLTQDSWGFGLRYAVSQGVYNGTANYDSLACTAFAPCFPLTQVNGIRNAFYNDVTTPRTQVNPTTPGTPITLASLEAIRLCNSATGITATNCGPAANLLANAAYLVWSTGRNGAQLPGGAGTDEGANLNNDVVYVFHPRAEDSTLPPLGPFDDLVLWQGVNGIISRMSAGGVLQ